MMNTYKNSITGAVINTPCKITADGWELVSQPSVVVKEEAKKNARKTTVRKRG